MRKSRFASLLTGHPAGLRFRHGPRSRPHRRPPRTKRARSKIRIVTLDPGHFHAALPHRESYPEVDSRVHVYAPLGPDLIEHLKRMARFNLRPENPTAWRLEMHTGPEFLDRFRKEKAGNVVVISGRNRGKIDYIQSAVGAGFHALVDKPWILRSEDLPKLEAVLDPAEKKGRIAFDMMTERFEITTQLQKELVNDPDDVRHGRSRAARTGRASTWRACTT